MSYEFKKVSPLHCYEISFYATVGLKGTNNPSARRIRVTVWAEDEEDAVLRVGDSLQEVVESHDEE